MDDIKFKMSEAAYFLDKLRESRRSDPDRRYFLSAFLTAARSMEDYLRKKYGHLPGFDDWFSKVIEAWKDDSGLSGLVRRRNRNVHDGQLETETTASVRVANLVCLVGPNDEAPVIDHHRVSTAAQPPSPRFESWVFTDENAGEVLDHCESVMKGLEKLVDECQKMFDSKKR